MAKFHRTQILKIDKHPIFSEINAASGSVWDACLALMGFYQVALKALRREAAETPTLAVFVERF